MTKTLIGLIFLFIPDNGLMLDGSTSVWYTYRRKFEALALYETIPVVVLKGVGVMALELKK